MKIKNCLLPILFLISGIFIVSAGLFASGVIKPFDLSEIIDVGSFNGISVKSNTEIIEQLISERIKTEVKNVPDEVNALWFDMSRDFSFPEEADAETMKSIVYNDLLFYKNFLPNAFFIKPDFNENSSEYDKNDFDLLKYFTDLLKQGTSKVFIVVDETDFLTNNEFDFDILKDRISYLNFDGILFSCNYGEYDKFISAVEFLYENINLYFPEICFGVEVQSDKEAMFADPTTISLCENKIIDFLYLDLMTTSSDVDFPFYSVAMWWNYFAEHYNIPLYCEHRLDKIFSGDELWSYSNEINLQLEALYDANSFDGSCFYNASQLKNKKALARDLSIFLNDVAGINQDSFFVSAMSLDRNKVSFTAETEDDDFFLFCNDKLVRPEDNLLKKSFILDSGSNIYKFRGNAAQYDFEIYNNGSLFYEFSPNINSAKISGNTFTCRAVCPKNSDVFAIFNGEYYKMVASETAPVSAPFEYCYYSVTVELPSNGRFSDLLSFLCLTDDHSQAKHVNLSFSDAKAYHTDITLVSDSVSTPYSDNGLGNALMCLVKNDYTETISEADDYDTYHPYRSKLLGGTIDYVERINVSSEGYIRYELKSGLNVYADSAVLITDGYVMPENNADVLLYDASAEKLQFSLDWLSPVNIVLENQDYQVGYEQFSFNIDSFDAGYVDINLYYCKSIDNLERINLDQSELFSSYELINSDENKITIRLHFRNKGIFFGYDLKKNADGIIEIVFKNPVSHIDEPVIMLDAGHGGISMTGTALADNSISEAQITLGIAFKTKAYLEANGFKVIMTRTDDMPLNLSERMGLCQSFSPDLFISIHCDGSDDSAECGTHTFYYSPFSQPLADCIHNKIVNTYLTDIYVEADRNYSKVDRKIKYYPFYVTRVDNCPSVLIETGFLTNSVEGNVLANPINQELIAKSIADGIFAYFDKIN